MDKKANYLKELSILGYDYLQTGEPAAIFTYLKTNSSLPGPRGNLELAAAFGDLLQDCPVTDQSMFWDLCLKMVALPPELAPVNSAEEFIPVCGAIGIGALAAYSLAYFHPALFELRKHAIDPRWRMREGVCMGLQRMLAVLPKQTLETLRRWVDEGNLLEMRAAAAAVAEPALLNQDTASPALELHSLITDKLVDSPDRRSEEFRVLRQALAYSWSVVVCAIPEPGFQALARLANLQDKDIDWILKENLKKNRLVKNFPMQVNEMKTVIEGRESSRAKT